MLVHNLSPTMKLVVLADGQRNPPWALERKRGDRWRAVSIVSDDEALRLAEMFDSVRTLVPARGPKEARDG